MNEEQLRKEWRKQTEGKYSDDETRRGAKLVADWWLSPLTEAYQLGQKGRDAEWRKAVGEWSNEPMTLCPTCKDNLSDLLEKMK